MGLGEKITHGLGIKDFEISEKKTNGLCIKGGLHRWPRFFSDRTHPFLDILLLMIKTALVPDFRVYMVILGVDFEFIT